MTTKFERTHNRIIQVALELFIKQGYKATSVADIAATAEVTEMTFYRHFTSKELILLPDPYDPVIADAILHQPAHLLAIEAAITGIRQALGEIRPLLADNIQQQLRVIALSPALRAAMNRSNQATEQAIASSLSERGASTSEARIVAAVVMAALTAALLEWAQTDQGDFDSMIQQALDVLEDRRG